MSKPNQRILYIFPTALQGRKAILEGVFLDNKPFISSIINEKHLKKPRNGSLYHYDNQIKFKNGSTIAIVGDDGDTLVGSSINLLCVSEAALVSKETLDYLLPSVIKIKGKILVVSSPRYGSHFNQTILENTGNVLTSVIPADQAYDNEGKRIYTDEELALAKSTMSIERFRSEYMVDLSSHNSSSIYGASFEMSTWVESQSLKDKKIFISLDLGINDSTDITFGTTDNYGNVEVIHHYRSRGKASQFYIDYIKQCLHEWEVPINMSMIVLPHDKFKITIFC
ncbi:MAG: hypothetical protein ACRC45_01240 [Cetobacterium sp.]